MLAFAALMLVVAVLMLMRRNGPPTASARTGGLSSSGRRLVASVAVGVAVGFLAGMFGVGGGFVIVPALVLLLGVEMKFAIGTSLVIIVINSAAGLAAHATTTVIDWPPTLVFTSGAVLAALLAAHVGSRANPDRLRRAFAALIVAVAVFVAVQAATA